MSMWSRRSQSEASSLRGTRCRLLDACQNRGIAIDPAPLLSCLRHGGAARSTQPPDCRLWVQSFHNEQTRSQESGTADALSAMKDDTLPGREIGVDFFQDRRQLGFRLRDLAIQDWKREKLHSMCLCLARFIFEIEILFFFGSQQRQHLIDSSPPPTGHFIFEPVATAWTRGQC